MNQFRSVTLIISVLIFVVSIVAGRSRSRTKPKPVPRESATPVTPAPTKRPTARMVTINFKQGEPVTGAFLQADAEAVQIEAQSGRLTIKLNEIDSLVFAANELAGSRPAAPQQNPPAAAAAADPTPPAARKAYQGLRKLADAVQLGLPY